MDFVYLWFYLILYARLRLALGEVEGRSALWNPHLNARNTILGVQLAEDMSEGNRLFYAKTNKVTCKANKVSLLNVDGVHYTL